MIKLTARPKIRVQMKAPTKPSTVFFGLNLINGVRPKSLPEFSRGQDQIDIPQMYAKMSLQMTSDAGTKNQINPSRMLLMIK